MDEQGDPAKLKHKKKVYKRLKQGQVTWEKYGDTA